MCLKPSFVWVKRGPDWVQQPKPCGDCWRCNRNWLNDYIGRSMCEASVSEVCCTVSMTYAPRDDLADKMLTPRHFQLFMKLLRNAGHKVRYLVAGEYGDLYGRSHFHVILFFKKLVPLIDPETGEYRGVIPRYKDDYPEGTTQADAPFCREIPHKRMVHIREWPHGHIKVDWSASEKSVRYVCKYIRSPDKANSWYSLSKKPALGAEFFARKAAKARELGVIPSTFEYLPPGGNRAKPYLMTGATRRDYLLALGLSDADRPKMSEWVQRSYDKVMREQGLKLIEDQWKISLRENAGKPEPKRKWFEGEPVFEPDPGISGKLPNDRIFNPKPRVENRRVSGYLKATTCRWPRHGKHLEGEAYYVEAARRQCEADRRAIVRWLGGECLTTGEVDVRDCQCPACVDQRSRAESIDDARAKVGLPPLGSAEWEAEFFAGIIAECGAEIAPSYPPGQT